MASKVKNRLNPQEFFHLVDALADYLNEIDQNTHYGKLLYVIVFELHLKLQKRQLDLWPKANFSIKLKPAEKYALLHLQNEKRVELLVIQQNSMTKLLLQNNQ